LAKIGNIYYNCATKTAAARTMLAADTVLMVALLKAETGLLLETTIAEAEAEAGTVGWEIAGGGRVDEVSDETAGLEELTSTIDVDGNAYKEVELVVVGATYFTVVVVVEPMLPDPVL
jgi:uncharacterized membrane protein